jgi:putative resolvase
MKSIKLSKWATANGYSYRGAYELYARGQLPGSYQLPSGSIMVSLPETKPILNDMVVVYCRVSTTKQKNDLERQVESVKTFCSANGWVISHVYKEIASGLNDNRKQLNALLANDKITKVVVTNKDRLTRFGFNYIKSLLSYRGCELIVMDKSTECQHDLMDDFVSVITSMAARVYGLRRHKSYTEKIINNIKCQS